MTTEQELREAAEEALREAAKFAKIAGARYEYGDETDVVAMAAQISLAHSQLALAYMAEARS